MVTRRNLLKSGVAIGGMVAMPSILRAQTATTIDLMCTSWPEPQQIPMWDYFQQMHPNVKLKLERLPAAQMISTLEVRLQARNALPDVYFVDGPLTPSYAVRGHLTPLDQIFGNDLSRYTKASLGQGTYGGKLMSLPMFSSSNVLFINEELFAKAGIAPPSADPAKRWTWEETLEAAMKLTNADAGIWGLTFEVADQSYQAITFPQSKGAQVISEDGLKATGYVDSPKFVEAMQFYQDLYIKHKVSPPGVFDNNLATEMFAGGRAAMFLSSTQVISTFQSRPNLKWAAAPMPYFAGGKAVTPTGSWHLGFNPRSVHKEAVTTFIKAAAEPEFVAKFFKLRPNPPVLNEAWNILGNDLSAPYWQIVKYEMNNTATPRPLTPGWLEYDSIMKVAFREIQGGADVQPRLKKAAQDLDRELAKYKA
jgi:multiple sugar transport system substrate-binding protein